MKKTFGMVISFIIFLTLTACGNTAGEQTVDSGEKQNTVQGAEEERYEVQQDTTEQQDTSEQQDTFEREDKVEQQDTPKQQETSEQQDITEQETDMGTKILVVYFSCTGTTKPLAEYAAEILEADLYEIVPEEPYTEADLAYYTDGRADREQNDPDFRPAISGGVENMDQYETIVIGYPKMEYGFNCVLCV